MGVSRKSKKQALPKKNVAKKLRKKIRKDSLLLYSANTWLAFMIAEKYYGNIHYVWCTSYFDSKSSPPITYTIPPSSSPFEIYLGFQNDVNKRDTHSSKIKENREGLLRGVEAKLKKGVINKKVADEIRYIINNADISDFNPLIYVIPFHIVKKMLQPVSVDKRARAISDEFIIENLPKEFFDVILGDVKRLVIG